LAWPVLAAGVQRAGATPVLILNEPIFVSQGANSDMRYNAMYPRQAYDEYRALLQDEAATQGWQYVDLWQAVENSEFTNTPIHLTRRGTLQLAQQVVQALLQRFH